MSTPTAWSCKKSRIEDWLSPFFLVYYSRLNLMEPSKLLSWRLHVHNSQYNNERQVGRLFWSEVTVENCVEHISSSHPLLTPRWTIQGAGSPSGAGRFLGTTPAKGMGLPESEPWEFRLGPKRWWQAPNFPTVPPGHCRVELRPPKKGVTYKHTK